MATTAGRRIHRIGHPRQAPRPEREGRQHRQPEHHGLDDENRHDRPSHAAGLRGSHAAQVTIGGVNSQESTVKSLIVKEPSRADPGHRRDREAVLPADSGTGATLHGHADAPAR